MTLTKTQRGKGKRTTSNGTTLEAVPALPDSPPMASPKVGTPRGPKTETGLTHKQEGFAREVANGSSLTDAYRKHYSAENMKQSVLWNEAFKLSVHPGVAERIKAIRAENDRNASHNSARTRQFVFERLQIEAATADNAGARIRALELLGKMDNVGMFRERQEVETIDSRAATEIEQELQDKLSALLGAQVA